MHIVRVGLLTFWPTAGLSHHHALTPAEVHRALVFHILDNTCYCGSDAQSQDLIHARQADWELLTIILSQLLY